MPNAYGALVNWLLREGGPVVRWLALTQVVDQHAEGAIRQAECDLLAAPNVRLWLSRLDGVKSFHNSGNDCFENVAGKLGEFGLRAGMKPLEARVARFIDWLAHRDRQGERGMMATLNRVIACVGLLRLGYTDSQAIRDFVLSRLDQLHCVAAWGRYDVFLPEDPSDMPKACRGRYRVVAPEFTPDGVCGLPYIHDLYMLAHMPRKWLTDSVGRKISGVVDYVLNDDYQRLPAGYGYLRDSVDGKARYYVLGWNVHLPGWLEMPPMGQGLHYFVQRLELMSCFEEARKTAWWSAAMALLRSYRTADGAFLLPAAWLQERPVGYWVTGAHTGLDDKRRSEQARKLESSFRLLRLLKEA